MLRRRTAVPTALAAAVLAYGSPVHAQQGGGPTVVIGGRGTIDTEVVHPGSGAGKAVRPVGIGTGGHGAGSLGAGGSGAGGSGAGGGAAGTDSGGAGPRCDYLRLPQLDLPGPPALQAYRYTCDDGTSGHLAVPVGGGPAAAAAGAPTAPVVTPAQLAQEAFNTLRLPEPTVEVNPEMGAGRYQLVQFPTWWWVENFEPVSQRTSAGPVWAQVTATPLYSTFDGGEGYPPERCDGPGTPWQHGLPSDWPGACTYSYRRAAEQVTVTVTVTWQVTWVGSGDTAGALPLMQLSTMRPLTVYERQAVVTSGRG